MKKKNPKVDGYFRRETKWRKESEKLRAILLKTPLKEELKWGKPCYTFQDSNVVIIQGFKEYCALLFCKGSLLKDAKGLLIQQTENMQAARQLRFTEAREITKIASFIKAYVKEAIEAEKAGLEVKYKETSDFKIPEELRNRFNEDRSFKKAFDALTPGRQRGYLLHFSAAKQSKTRESRIEKWTQQILNGKGLHDPIGRSRS
jgi:uncharacterized protein YdeI (YjbR/CyaY-like superfamily)